MCYKKAQVFVTYVPTYLLLKVLMLYPEVTYKMCPDHQNRKKDTFLELYLTVGWANPLPLVANCREYTHSEVTVYIMQYYRLPMS